MVVQSSSRSAGSARAAAYLWVKERVAEVPPDESLFITEGEIARGSGVSRTPAREALMLAAAEGLLTIEPKKGAFVPELSESMIVAVMQVRMIIEEASLRETFAHGAPDTESLKQLLRRQQECIYAPALFIAADREFHRRLVATAGNSVMVEVYDRLRDRQTRMGRRAIEAEPTRSQAVMAEHTAIVQALADDSLDTAISALHRHLQLTLRTLVPQLERFLDPRSGVLGRDANEGEPR